MGVDFSVRFEDVRRGPNKNVTGKVTLKVSGEVVGQKFDQQLDGRSFDFPEDSEQQVYDQDFGPVKIKATVFEKPHGQCCIRGHAHVNIGIGGGVGADIPGDNCTQIQE